jgi:hypothetical protein
LGADVSCVLDEAGRSEDKRQELALRPIKLVRGEIWAGLEQDDE